MFTQSCLGVLLCYCSFPQFTNSLVRHTCLCYLLLTQPRFFFEASERLLDLTVRFCRHRFARITTLLKVNRRAQTFTNLCLTCEKPHINHNSNIINNTSASLRIITSFLSLKARFSLIILHNFLTFRLIVSLSQIRNQLHCWAPCHSVQHVTSSTTTTTTNTITSSHLTSTNLSPLPIKAMEPSTSPINGGAALVEQTWGFGGLPGLPPAPGAGAPVAAEEEKEEGEGAREGAEGGEGGENEEGEEEGEEGGEGGEGGEDVEDVDAMAVAFAEADQWDAFADEAAAAEEVVEGAGAELEDEEEFEEDSSFGDLDPEDPAVERLQAGLDHLDHLRADVDDLDAQLPVDEVGRGDPAAVRARASLLLAEEEIRGAFRMVWESRQFDREVAAVAREGFHNYEDEVRRLVALLTEAHAEADVARESADSNAAALEEARLELATLRRRLEDAGL